jgi:L-fucose mutarotase
MGHGDELVIADGMYISGKIYLNLKGNYPSASNAQKLIRADGQNVLDILFSILKFFPIDKYADGKKYNREFSLPFAPDHVAVMALEPQDVGKIPEPPIWKEFDKLTKEAEGNWVKITPIPRKEFYERSKRGKGYLKLSIY